MRTKLIAPLLFLLAVLFAFPAQAQMACPDPFSARGPCAAVTASAIGTIAAVPATLPAVAGKTTYICGFQITSNATAGTSVPATVTGTISGTLNYNQPVGVAPAVAPLIVNFTPCVPASAINTAIVVTTGAAGTGGVTAVTTTGYQL